MNLVIRPLTPELWPALEDLFGKHGACNGCWCSSNLFTGIASTFARAGFKAVARRVPSRRPGSQIKVRADDDGRYSGGLEGSRVYGRDREEPLRSRWLGKCYPRDRWLES
jgi:hypothetical protein